MTLQTQVTFARLCVQRDTPQRVWAVACVSPHDRRTLTGEKDAEDRRTLTGEKAALSFSTGVDSVLLSCGVTAHRDHTLKQHAAMLSKLNYYYYYHYYY